MSPTSRRYSGSSGERREWKLNSGTSPAGRRLDAQLLIDSSIQVPHQLCHRYFKHFADAQERGDRNGSSRFNLLPVTGGEAEANHILLAVAALLAKLADSLAQGAEEFTLIHTPVCSLLRADSPRAD